MENLGRGVAAVRANETAILVSWRLLGLDPDGIGFNVYRASGNGDAEKLNGEVLTKGTNFVDDDANSEADNTYHVRTVVDGEEGDKSGSFTLSGDHEVEPVIRIPLEDTGNIKYAWVGDLDGDGEYDYVVDRTGDQQAIEAYHRNGTLLWTVDLGANSENQNNISPGSTAISVGNWDGVTVYDFDSDGRAEVALRIANGVTFGDGESFKHDNDDEQFIAFLDGETGALLSKAEIPTDYIEDGPLASRLGVGYLDGKTPYLVAFMKNRQESGDFNLIYAAYTFDGEASMAWKWLRGDQKLSDGHNGRIVDADRDGVDEIHEIGFTLNGDGTLKYSLRDYDIIHGDRFYVAKIDPDQDGLQGYGIQQDNENLITDYYYDAAEGKVIWTHKGDEVYDVGRGVIGDIDPTSPGLEVWHFDGVWSALENESLTNSSLYPWPQMTILWDGDELAELFNDGKVEKWDYENPSVPRSVPRIFKVGDYGGVTVGNGNPIFIGDILGDWREEFITINSDSTELLVFTTNEPTDIRLYTLAHNPAYRNDMTLKGYMQSHYVDYYLGADMSTPDQPDIKYVE
ncbi:hypothetical protein BDV25DRAFT_127096 [Aspergillus avenaceus]|uniref:Uncharacterized protein n=1 Tax=Aspergillus avenaceus TaxID=36643 RepID=A0A5N6U4T4_ASPAV|nr:hypothetical protein BDV25DRAFT_127096 [Aspergillus avenaceus]